jgi:phosphate-induced protein 1
MKSRTTNLLLLSAHAIAVSLAMLTAPVLAQNGNPNLKTNSKILYHDGPVMQGTSAVYLIWYGNWETERPGNNGWTIGVLTDLVSNLGSSPYFRINTLYPDASETGPSGGLIYAGAVRDSYSHGPTLTVSDIQGVVSQQLAAGSLPLNTAAIYVVLASSDVTDIYPNSTTYCTPPFAPPHHGVGLFGGTLFKYAFIGNPARCPTTAASQFIGPGGSLLPSPNDDSYADAIASTLAHALSIVVTNPTGTAWFDRYGLEDATKCQGTFGETYPSSNGSPANMRLSQRDYLIQQNWVNARRGYCALSLP